MYDTITDEDGTIHIFDDGARNAAPRVRGRFGKRRRRRNIVVHQGGYGHPMPPYNPHQQPITYVRPAPPTGMYVPPQGMDMQKALGALGALLPAAGQLISAFQRAPERPTLTGSSEKDLAATLEFMAESFEKSRSGAKTAGVLATAGAVMEILAGL